MVWWCYSWIGWPWGKLVEYVHLVVRCEKFASVKKKGESSDVSSGGHHGFIFFGLILYAITLFSCCNSHKTHSFLQNKAQQEPEIIENELKLNGETHFKPIQTTESDHRLHVFWASLSFTVAPTMEGDQNEDPRWEPRASTNMDTAENAVKWDQTANKEATDPPH